MFGDMSFLNEEQEKVDQKLAEMELTVTAGQNQVLVKANGKGEILDLTIDPKLFEEGDKEAIEDFVLIAMNEMYEKIMEAQMKESKDLLSGLLPGM
jgi:DNA-binding YbaB/EbfC family protein